MKVQKYNVLYNTGEKTKLSIRGIKERNIAQC